MITEYTLEDAERVLDAMSLEEVLEQAELDERHIIRLLLNQGLFEMPDYLEV